MSAPLDNHSPLTPTQDLPLRQKISGEYSIQQRSRFSRKNLSSTIPSGSAGLDSRANILALSGLSIPTDAVMADSQTTVPDSQPSTPPHGPCPLPAEALSACSEPSLSSSAAAASPNPAPAAVAAPAPLLAPAASAAPAPLAPPTLAAAPTASVVNANPLPNPATAQVLPAPAFVPFVVPTQGSPSIAISSMYAKLMSSLSVYDDGPLLSWFDGVCLTNLEHLASQNDLRAMETLSIFNLVQIAIRDNLLFFPSMWARFVQNIQFYVNLYLQGLRGDGSEPSAHVPPPLAGPNIDSAPNVSHVDPPPQTPVLSIQLDRQLFRIMGIFLEKIKKFYRIMLEKENELNDFAQHESNNTFPKSIVKLDMVIPIDTTLKGFSLSGDLTNSFLLQQEAHNQQRITYVKHAVGLQALFCADQIDKAHDECLDKLNDKLQKIFASHHDIQQTFSKFTTNEYSRFNSAYETAYVDKCAQEWYDRVNKALHTARLGYHTDMETQAFNKKAQEEKKQREEEINLQPNEQTVKQMFDELFKKHNKRNSRSRDRSTRNKSQSRDSSRASSTRSVSFAGSTAGSSRGRSRSRHDTDRRSHSRKANHRPRQATHSHSRSRSRSQSRQSKSSNSRASSTSHQSHTSRSRSRSRSVSTTRGRSPRPPSNNNSRKPGRQRGRNHKGRQPKANKAKGHNK